MGCPDVRIVDDLGSFAVFAAICGSPTDVAASLVQFPNRTDIHDVYSGHLELKVQDIRLNKARCARAQ
jgi:hypothetical protein